MPSKTSSFMVSWTWNQWKANLRRQGITDKVVLQPCRSFYHFQIECLTSTTYWQRFLVYLSGKNAKNTPGVSAWLGLMQVFEWSLGVFIAVSHLRLVCREACLHMHPLNILAATVSKSEAWWHVPSRLHEQSENNLLPRNMSVAKMASGSSGRFSSAKKIFPQRKIFHSIQVAIYTHTGPGSFCASFRANALTNLATKKNSRDRSEWPNRFTSPPQPVPIALQLDTILSRCPIV